MEHCVTLGRNGAPNSVCACRGFRNVSGDGIVGSRSFDGAIGNCSAVLGSSPLPPRDGDAFGFRSERRENCDAEGSKAAFEQAEKGPAALTAWRSYSRIFESMSLSVVGTRANSGAPPAVLSDEAEEVEMEETSFVAPLGGVRRRRSFCEEKSVNDTISAIWFAVVVVVGWAC